jgi:tetratricopeptide (TPR) repeat protein
VALAASLLVAAVARGAPGNEEEAEAAAGNGEAKKKFAEGNERYARGDYEAAVESFRAAIAADPRLPGPYRNLGLAYRALNRCADALPNYEKYLELKPDSRFTERVRREIDICHVKLGQAPSRPVTPAPPEHTTTGTPRAPEAQSILHVAANLIGGEATDEATVKVDGLVRGATPLTIPVTAGRHDVHLSRTGFESAAATIEVAPGERKDVELTMNKVAVDTRPAVLPVEPVAQAKPRPSYRKPAWILIGVAGAAAAVGAGFGIAESGLYRDAVATPPMMTTRATVNDDRDRGQTYAAVAYTGLGVGGAALLAAGIVFIVDGARGETHERQKYVIAPSATRDGAGLVATVRF